MMGLALMGCAGSSKGPVQGYLQALAAKPGVELSQVDEAAALERFRVFYSSITEESVRRLTRETYADDVYFYDSLKTVRGAETLEEYFVETAKNTEFVRVQVQDVSRSGTDYYVRWTMEIQLKKLKRGETLQSAGITHLRFDRQGKIVLHYDYWDAAQGFFEHVPVLGGGIRAIKARL